MEKENEFSDNVFSSLIASISTNERIKIIFEWGGGARLVNGAFIPSISNW